MSTITKEWLQSQISAIKAVGITDSNTLQAFEITLASLEAEPYGYVHKAAYEQAGSCGLSSDHEAYRDSSTHIAVYTAPPAPVSDYPETLPCPVMLEPGLRFGKGVPTRTILGALQRRAEYCAELNAMTPEQRAEHGAGMKEFAAMLQGAENAESRCSMQTAPALDSSPKNPESRCSNSHVIQAQPLAWKVIFTMHGQPGSNFKNIFEDEVAMESAVSLHRRGGFDVQVIPLIANPNR